ncbi:MAG: inositol 2-dehydrogenase [Bacteroidota bacterium]
MTPIKAGILGMGRIGKIHLENLLNRIPEADVLAVMNPSEAGQQFARDRNVPNVSSDPRIIFDNAEINAVLICSPSDTHAAYITRAAEAGKAIFCEKPLDLSLEKIQEILALTEQHQVPMMVAFNQRFDPDFARIKSVLDEGKIGQLRTIKLTSRDPAPPPISYIKSSGGMFLDMVIHDFDNSRHLASSEVAEVYAKGFNWVDPAIGEAGDIDTAVILLTFETGATAIIENCRQAAYGYDQRLEVFGSKGMALADNNFKDTHLMMDEQGMHRGRLLDFFMDRYRDSYFHEMNAFIQAMSKGEKPPVDGTDGLRATEIALAANLSMEENRPVRIEEIR